MPGGTPNTLICTLTAPPEIDSRPCIAAGRRLGLKQGGSQSVTGSVPAPAQDGRRGTISTFGTDGVKRWGGSAGGCPCLAVGQRQAIPASAPVHSRSATVPFPAAH
jgi:hypothetical protein